ncbi:type-2 ice-structuring protein-like [Epinephelus lanceolatus]|uniref:galactose-specific lectin nattectin-like isoform X2 n=1 Tax=Epinephelus lanceolatus TaxID=310571 RepID=UPI0014468912|nr:galactose-specific lectin nattectin-like isoform X2 [Epinephelus lanceolatus]
MLSLILLFGLALGAVSSPDVKLQRGNCPMFWYSFNGRCYKYIATDMTWADAEFHCLSEGANLVSIHSLDEHNFVRSLIQNFDPSQGRTWYGLSDIHKEGNWMWSDGCPVRFVFWYSGQPDGASGQNCVQTNVFGSAWNDNPCSLPSPFVCATRIICP